MLASVSGLPAIIMPGPAATHDDGRLRVGWRKPQLIDQALFERRGVSERYTRQQAGVEAERDGGGASQNGRAQPAPYPFPGPEKTLHGGENPPPGEERQRKRRRRTRGIGEQQERGFESRPLQRGPSQDQAQDRPGARRPKEARGDAEQKRGRNARFAIPVSKLRKPVSQSHDRSCQPLGERRKEQDEAEAREQHEGCNAAISIGLYRPAAADGTVVGDDAQSIYGFRAATVRNILDFPKKFDPPAAIITLDRNYRSTVPILTAANAVIALAKERFTKNLWSDRSSAEKPALVAVQDDAAQAHFVVERVLANREEGVPLKEQAVLVSHEPSQRGSRNRAQPAEHPLRQIRRAQIPGSGPCQGPARGVALG